MKEEPGHTEKFRRLLEHISDGILALDRAWRIFYLNPAAARLLNREAGDLLHKNIWEEFPASVGGKVYQACNEALSTGKSVVVEDFSRALETWTRAVIYPGPEGFTIYFHDITAERKASIRAETSEQNFRLFVDRITDGFIVLDREFRYVYVNQKISELVHREVQELLGRNIWDVFPDAVNSLTYKAFQTAFKEQRFISNIDYYEPLQLWQENYIYPSPEGLSIFIRDISDRKKLELELRQKERDRQFELMITALEAQEKERTFIGQELHDNVNQLLVASKLMLALMRDDAQRASPALFSKCIDNLEKAIEENRRISHELVTPDLREQTLVAQLQALTQTMLGSAKIQVTLDAAGFSEALLDDPKKLALYRIAQEQCTNIIKYSRATRVHIELSGDAGQVMLVIADNGVGMERVKLHAGIGLRNIGSRAGFFGGEIRVTTAPGRGFELKVTLPSGATVPAYPAGAW
jgi:PAS domain S-box-containing protein